MPGQIRILHIEDNSALDELDGTARLSRLEADVQQISQVQSNYHSLSEEDKKGQWALRLESRKGQFMLAIAIVGGILTSSFIGQFARWLIDKLK